MRPYNGFTGLERAKSWKLQQQAMEAGLLVPTSCEMCSQGSGLLMPHLENYDEPIKDAKFLCVECHMRLHSRFSAPVQWLNHLLELRAGKVCKPYAAVFHFFKVPNFDWSKTPLPNFIPDPAKWWENLPSEPINFRGLHSKM